MKTAFKSREIKIRFFYIFRNFSLLNLLISNAKYWKQFSYIFNTVSTTHTYIQGYWRRWWRLKNIMGIKFFYVITPSLSGKTFEIYLLLLRFSYRVSLIWYLERDFLYLGQFNRMFISISKQRISKTKRGHNFDFRNKCKYLCMYI